MASASSRNQKHMQVKLEETEDSAQCESLRPETGSRQRSKRQTRHREKLAVKSLPAAIPSGTPAFQKRKEFTLDDIAAVICEDPPDVMDVRDDQLCASLLKGMNRGMLEDMTSYFMTNEGLRSDEHCEWGPSKWNYTKGDFYDSFDYYVATGCPNCGSPYELDQSYAFHLNPPTLLCLACGHRACQLHTNRESESLVDRLEKKISNDEDGDVASVFTSATSDQNPPPEELPVYVRGIRERYDFGQGSKSWWQNRYIPKAIRLRELDRTITMITMMSKFKAPTIKELCEVCSNGEAFYTTYQARSADEGMTIMYECTRCHHRKIFNN